MAPQQKIPVALPGDDEEKLQYYLRYNEELQPDLVLLNPDSQVIVLALPRDEDASRYVGRDSRANRPRLPEDLSEIIIRTPRKLFRQSKVLEARWRRNATTTKYVEVGEPSRKCPRCRPWIQLRKEPRWVRGRRIHYQDWPKGCELHVKREPREIPHPDAGKVICRFSTVKLYGLASGTKILYHNGKAWVRATVGEYEPWREKQRAETKLRKQLANDHHRFLRRATRYDRLLQDDGWLKAEPSE